MLRYTLAADTRGYAVLDTQKHRAVYQVPDLNAAIEVRDELNTRYLMATQRAAAMAYAMGINGVA